MAKPVEVPVVTPAAPVVTPAASHPTPPVVVPPPFQTPAPTNPEPTEAQVLISRRDYFAGQVLMGAFANRRMTQLTNEVGRDEALRITAEIADQMADEMMRRRS